MAVSPQTADSERGDGSLVAAARAGDRGALTELIGRHRPVLVALCRRFLGSSALVEDAAQEACLQAMLCLDRLRAPEAFGPWLAGIGMNVCRQWLRERPTLSLSALELSGGWSGSEVVSASPSPEDLAELADLEGRVRRAVMELPAGQRSAVVRFYLGGLTYAETAAALGVGVPAVKTRLHKGRASLRKRLQSFWEEPTMTANDLVEMRIADVRRGVHDATPAAHLVLLEEVDGDRRLPIWIGPQEGMSMARLLEGVELPRPMGPQFMFNALRAVRARVVEVRIDRLAEKTFYAVAVIEGPSGTVEVDARPSDALNAALLADARVTVRRELLEVSTGFEAADANADMLANLTEKFPESARDIVRAEVAACAAREAAGTSPTA